MDYKLAKISEDIHDYIDELDDLLNYCLINPTIPERAIKSRSLVFSEIPRLMEATEDLTQALVEAIKHLDGQARLEAIRSLESVNMNLNELLPARKSLKAVK